MKKHHIKYLPLGAFLLFFGKVIAVSPSWQELGITAVLAAVAFLYEHKSQNKEIEDMKALIEKTEQRLADQDKKIEENRQFVSSIKLGTSMKGQAGWGQSR